jgi:hypothetical protein
LGESHVEHGKEEQSLNQNHHECECDEAKEKAEHDDKMHNKLYESIERVHTRLSAASSNGLFALEKVSVSFKEVMQELECARKCLKINYYLECENHICHATAKYSDAINTKNLGWWRFKYIYAGHILIYLIGLLIGIFLFYNLFYFELVGNNETPKLLDNIIGKDYSAAAVHAVVWGTIGSILREIWFLKAITADRRYTNSWRVYFIVGPFIGAIFGAMIFFLVVGGLIVIGDEANSGSPINQSGSPINQLIIIALALLAGFNWEWAIMILKRIGDSFQSTPEEDKDRR